MSRLVAVLALLVALVAPPVALAHEGVPGYVSTVTAVEPALATGRSE